MSQAQHTPGPWRVYHTDDAVSNAAKLGVVAEFDVAYCNTGPFATREANARLIAAAPDLLAALDSLLQLDVAQTSLELLDRGISTRTPLAAWLHARAAIAKAKGDQS